jgi:uncharacterized protein
MNIFSEEILKSIEIICNQRHVLNLYVFGSFLTDNFNQQSDIDFLVEFDKLSSVEYSDSYFDLCTDLEELLGRQVDLVTIKSVKNPYFKAEVFNTRQLIFAA